MLSLHKISALYWCTLSIITTSGLMKHGAKGQIINVDHMNMDVEFDNLLRLDPTRDHFFYWTDNGDSTVSMAVRCDGCSGYLGIGFNRNSGAGKEGKEKNAPYHVMSGF